MLKSNHYYNVNINTTDAHPTRCETRLEWAALGMNRYLCPVEIDNYVHFYSQVYGYPEDDIKRFKDRGRLGYWLRNGLYAVLKRGVISNNNFSLGCNVCGENKSYSRKCQICGKMTNFKNLACKAQREFISLYRSKEDLCVAPEKCSEIYIYAKDNIGECLKFGIKMDYLLNDEEIIKRGAILTTLFVKMLSNKKGEKLMKEGQEKELNHPKNMDRTSVGLRNALFDEIDALRQGNSNPARARALAMLANTALSSVQTEIEYHKYVSDIQVADGSAKLGYLNLGGQPIDLGTTK